jgi:DNA-binding MarR family transcriptional regulator
VTRRPRSLLLDLYAANNKAGQLVERAAAVGGTTAEDYAFLSIVAGLEPVTPTEISREYGLSLSTVLFRANRNVELGHLERVTNPHDGRSFLLRLTGAGRKVWAAAAVALREEVAALEARLDRPATEIQAMLVAFQGAVEAQLADVARR